MAMGAEFSLQSHTEPRCFLSLLSFHHWRHTSVSALFSAVLLSYSRHQYVYMRKARMLTGPVKAVTTRFLNKTGSCICTFSNTVTHILQVYRVGIKAQLCFLITRPTWKSEALWMNNFDFMSALVSGVWPICREGLTDSMWVLIYARKINTFTL